MSSEDKSDIAGSSGVNEESDEERDEERDDLLSRFVPVNVCSARTVDLLRGAISSHGPTIHECDQCDYQTPSRYNLGRHARTHTGEKPFECELCQKKFGRKYHLKEHIC